MFAWLKKFLKPPFINAESSIGELLAHYPHAADFLLKRYHLEIRATDKLLSLTQFAKHHRLPPPQILFMEIQTAEQLGSIRQISATELSQWLARKNESPPAVLDAREGWELKLGAIPTSRALSQALWEEIQYQWNKATPIVVYCHFGVRSLDVATELLKLRFTDVSILKGGIDAWSELVDPAIPKYTGAYC